MCLASTGYGEARSEKPIVEMCVMQVAMERAERKQRGICSVVSQPSQFQGYSVDRSYPNILERRAFARSTLLAVYINLGFRVEFCSGATHFAEYPQPGLEYKSTIGPFIFQEGAFP